MLRPARNVNQDSTSAGLGEPDNAVRNPGCDSTDSGDGTNYDVTRDGKQILLVAPDTQAGNTTTEEIQIVSNWHEELKRLVPTN